jgi:fructose-1,6-bisphosphatase/sedoheptulose 1,7-bisphosphatase-like protein
MCNPIKKAINHVKKTFKRVMKVVKKIKNSKIFKIVVIAAAIYFTAGLAAGAGASVGAVGTGTVAATGTTVAATAGTVAGTAATAAASTGFMATLGTAVAANPLLTSTALTMGGNMLSSAASSSAERKRDREDKEELDRNNRTQLNISGVMGGATNRFAISRGQAPNKAIESPQAPQAPAPLLASAANYQSTNSASTLGGTMNTEPTTQKFYDNSSNKWSSV